MKDWLQGFGAVWMATKYTGPVMLLVFNWCLSLSNMNTSWEPWELITISHLQWLLPYFQLWFPAFPLHNYLQQTSGQQKHLFSAVQRRTTVMGPILRSLPRDGSHPSLLFVRNKHYSCIAAFIFWVSASSSMWTVDWRDCGLLCPQAEARPRLTEQPLPAQWWRRWQRGSAAGRCSPLTTTPWWRTIPTVGLCAWATWYVREDGISAFLCSSALRNGCFCIMSHAFLRLQVSIANSDLWLALPRHAWLKMRVKIQARKQLHSCTSLLKEPAQRAMASTQQDLQIFQRKSFRRGTEKPESLKKQPFHWEYLGKALGFCVWVANCL